MPPLEPYLPIEFAGVLALSHISPFDVEEVVAGWMKVDPRHEWTHSGFVVRLKSGNYGYLVSERNGRQDWVQSTTQKFKEEPTHLYVRGREWVFDREILNASTEIAKSQANYPTGGLAASANPGQVVRIPI